jgi:hypothetical protein
MVAGVYLVIGLVVLRVVKQIEPENVTTQYHFLEDPIVRVVIQKKYFV